MITSFKRTSTLFLALAVVLVQLVSVVSYAGAQVTPEMVDVILAPGESVDIEKTVGTPEIPPKVDVCLLEDETGSFGDDIANLQGGTTASDIYDTVKLTSPDAHFAVAGFRDYPVAPYGGAGDHVYRLLSSMSPVKADWLAGVAALTAGGGADLPEAQYDAIVAAAGPGPTDYPDVVGPQDDCGWRPDAAGAKRILVVTTDAAFHNPGVAHLNNASSTIAALNARGIIVIGLKAPGAGVELDALAAATGGSVQPLSPDGSDIGDAIVAGLGNLPITVTPHAVGCDPLDVSFVPPSDTVPSGEDAHFVETIAVPNDHSLEGTSIHCTVEFTDESGTVIGVEKIWVEIPDVTPPRAQCVETVNPHGKTVPPAGSTTLPGPKGGQNEDGYYTVSGKDNLDPAVDIYVTDSATGTVFGPYPSGTKIKYTEANGATPNAKKIGNTNQTIVKGQAVAVTVHITGQGDAIVTAVDAAGNTSPAVSCLVPPLPK